MKKNLIRKIITTLIACGFLTGCATTKVERVAVDKTIDLSGRWNDTDARKVSEEMIKDCLERPWVGEFNKKFSRDPIVIIGPIANLSDEHINAAVFLKDLERNLLNSGKVKFVASKDERLTVRDERQQQQTGSTDPATIKAIGKEAGADFMLQGSINSVKDEVKSSYVVLYQVNLELVDLTTNQKKWIGQSELKKTVRKSNFSI